MEWYMYLIAAGVVAVLVTLVWLYFKYVKGSGASPYFEIGSKVAATIATFLPDDTEKLDAHDVVLVISRLSEEIPKWAKDQSNATWADCKEEVVAFIKEQRAAIPQLEELPQETIEQIAEILFKVAVAFVK